jgi:poly(A) polymerase
MNEQTADSFFPEVLEKLFAGFAARCVEAYLIGPRARDLASGESILEANSFDLTVNASMSTIEDVFRDTFNISSTEGKDEKVRLITFRLPLVGDEAKPGRSQISFNVGPFRNYLPPLRSLRGQSLSGIILDLATREVTVQAFGYAPDGTLIDPFGGTIDYREKLIRPVFPVDTIFRESASWLLKIARYVSRYGFDAAREVRAAAERDASNILDVPRDIWLKEMNKVLSGPVPSKGLAFLAECRVMNYILPEVAAMAEFTDDGGRHKDVWAHTKQVVQNAEPTSIVRWAALCHDLGKVWTRQTFRDGKVHFFRHEDVSAMLFEGISARFCFPPEESDPIMYIIKNHSRVNLYRDDWTDSAVRRLIRDVGEYLDYLVAFSKADLTSKRIDRVEMVRSLLTDLQIRIMEIRQKDTKLNPLPKGLGNDIMKRFSIPAGPRIGALRDVLLDAIEDGKIQENQDTTFYMDWLESNGHIDRDA